MTVEKFFMTGFDLAMWTNTNRTLQYWLEPEISPKAPPNAFEHTFWPHNQFVRSCWCFISQLHAPHLKSTMLQGHQIYANLVIFTLLLFIFWRHVIAVVSFLLFIAIFAVVVAVVRSWDNVLWLEAEPMVKGEDTTDDWPKEKDHAKKNIGRW